jgi:hypothetical protein
MTTRDQVWNAVLKQLIRTGYFKISDLPFDEEQRHTVRRVLREMEDLDWLERESNRSAIWRIGDSGQLHLQVSADTIREAHSA